MLSEAVGNGELCRLAKDWRANDFNAILMKAGAETGKRKRLIELALEWEQAMSKGETDDLELGDLSILQSDDL